MTTFTISRAETVWVMRSASAKREGRGADAYDILLIYGVIDFDGYRRRRAVG